MSEELLSLISLAWQDYVVGRSWKVVQIRKGVLRAKYDVLLIHHEPLLILGRGDVLSQAILARTDHANRGRREAGDQLRSQE
jgi:hypothetical protein